MRPVLPAPWTPLDVALEASAAAGLLAHLSWMLPRLPHLPAKVPVHFDWSGRPDRWGSRNELAVLPVVALVMYTLLTVIARLPHLANYPIEITPENAAHQYRMTTVMLSILKVEITWLLAFLGWKITRIAQGEASTLGTAVPIVILASVLLTPTVWLVLTLAARP